MSPKIGSPESLIGLYVRRPVKTKDSKKFAEIHQKYSANASMGGEVYESSR